MLTSITPLLTLAAFAVHAVLGCCWHHEHRANDGSCQHPAGQTLVACDGQSAGDGPPARHLGACQHHGHASHLLPSEHDLSPRDGAPFDGIHAIDFGDACYCAGSGEHSHDCGGAHCTYVRSGHAPLPPATTQSLNWLAEWGNPGGQSVEAGRQAGNRWTLLRAAPVGPASQACAVLQIWQI